MQKVNFGTSSYRFQIAQIFISACKIAKVLGVTPPTVYRWRDGKVLMTKDQLDKLGDIVMNHLHEVTREVDPEFARKLKELVAGAMYDDAPDIVYKDTQPGVRPQTKVLRKELVRMLNGKTRRGRQVLEAMSKLGFSEAITQRVSKQMGVKKTVKGFGVNAKSYWSYRG